MARKKALITGVTGQDGAYLAAMLLDKGYEVHGIKRRSSMFNTKRIDGLFAEAQQGGLPFFLSHGDLTDASSIVRVIQDVRPDEIYNLAAQSHVKVSFEAPEYTADTAALGCLRVLEAVRLLGMQNDVRFYQASTSELFGDVAESPQTERTPFRPRSPYAVAKLYAYWATVNYREAYGIFASNGILFNHESPLRGETFVTRKVTRSVARMKLGLQESMALGNLDAKRDWGHARDFVRAMWSILQIDRPDDFVVATGEQHSVREFVTTAFAKAGIGVQWQGTGPDEQGIDTRTGRVLVRVDPKYYRPTEVESLLGDATKARTQLGWTPQTSFDELVGEMVEADLAEASQEALVGAAGYAVYGSIEEERQGLCGRAQGPGRVSGHSAAA